MPGITCVYLALGGNPGMSSAPSCVLRTRSPFATVTVIGFTVFLLYSSGASMTRKWLLAPESSIAHLRMSVRLVSIS